MVHIYDGILLSHQKERLHNIRNRKIGKRRKGRMKGGQTEGGMNHERLWALGNKLRASEGKGWGIGPAR